MIIRRVPSDNSILINLSIKSRSRLRGYSCGGDSVITRSSHFFFDKLVQNNTVVISYKFKILKKNILHQIMCFCGSPLDLTVLVATIEVLELRISIIL